MPYDFDKGLGIGGAGRHDLRAEEQELIARGQIKPQQHERRGPMPNGQLWEPCPRCGDEPVCLDCGYCRRHCVC